jgi:hypothetical protein
MCVSPPNSCFAVWRKGSLCSSNLWGCSFRIFVACELRLLTLALKSQGAQRFFRPASSEVPSSSSISSLRHGSFMFPFFAAAYLFQNFSVFHKFFYMVMLTVWLWTVRICNAQCDAQNAECYIVMAVLVWRIFKFRCVTDLSVYLQHQRLNLVFFYKTFATFFPRCIHCWIIEHEHSLVI